MQQQLTRTGWPIQRADEAARYGYSLQGGDFEAQSLAGSPPGLGLSVFRLVMAVPLIFAFIIAYLAALLSARRRAPDHLN